VPVRTELNRILTSGSFRVADRGRKLLQYVVEETLAGRANRIKAYSIATIAFGRDSSFDPQSDPIVRIEAGHVRRALERYYQSECHVDPIRITIPTGGYVPTFSQNCAQEGRTGFEVEINGAIMRFGPDTDTRIVTAVIKALKDKE
jgi:arginine/lysine/ornithine decarboxylase